MLAAIEAAELARVRLLLRTWGDGGAPPAPRPPLAGFDVHGEIRRMGLWAEYLDARRRRVRDGRA
ncbi:hypothetical protein BJF78_04335 [Pseudonocardia sp. CNS-139]|nr:hypothetical protein BJF78_04335 [Pseudonocardia sp. CNS-139]